MGSLWKRKQRENQEAAEARFNSSQTEPLMWRHRHPRSHGRPSWRVVSPGSILSHRKDRGRSKKPSSSLTFVSPPLHLPTSPPQNQFDPQVFTVNFNSTLSRPDAGLAWTRSHHPCVSALLSGCGTISLFILSLQLFSTEVTHRLLLFAWVFVHALVSATCLDTSLNVGLIPKFRLK